MRNKIYIILLIIAALGCKQPYNPKAISSVNSVGYLVVEGVINTGNDSTIIKLSRTVPLSSKARSKPEPGAVVTIVNNTGNSYQLTESGNGFYKTASLNLSPTNLYGLRIVTSAGVVYQSDLVAVKNSPPIDSVYYQITNNGLNIYADTHDPANQTKYYRWEFIDTYLFHSGFSSFSYLSHNPDTVLPRSPSQMVYFCWRSDTSSNILINSSAKLAKDIIADNLLTSIASNAEQIEDRYSIIVKQYALTPEAFNYFQQLKKNSEQLGSIFDAQPSELPGNIHCITNPSEPVLGYITAGTPSQMRIFIDNRKLPAWRAVNPYQGCKLDTDLFKKPIGNGSTFENDVAYYIYSGIESPVYPVAPPGSPIIGYAASSPFCVDCTLRGTNIKPSFWIDY